MKINFYNAEKILRLTPIGKKTISIADDILNNKVRLSPVLSNIQVNDLNELWEMRFESAQTTYSLYTYTFHPVSYLLNAYEVSENEVYLERAIAYVNSFIKWEAQEKKNITKSMRRVLLGDHAFSNRTQSLCYLLSCLIHANKKIPQYIISTLLSNGEYLSDICNYKHYNHGLMMDIALLGLVSTFEGNNISYPNHFKKNLISRLSHSLTRDLTEDGVHIENSPGYHFWILRFLKKLKEPLSVLDPSLHKKASCSLRKAQEYASLIVRPDGTVPTIGDTHAGVKYKCSKGLKSEFLRDANKVIFRDPTDKIWAYFSSGYKTHVHKHGDNGVFNLYYKGTDILIDPGFLNYENSINSLKLKKTSYHNTVRPKGENQTIRKVNIAIKNQSYKENIGGSEIIGFRDFGKYEIALARISDYDLCFIVRMICWIKPGVFLIYDQLEGISKGIEQYFHIGPELTLNVINQNVNLLNNNKKCICQIKQFTFDDESNYETDFPVAKIIPSFHAKKFNLKKDSQRIVFESNKNYFLTMIQLDHNNEVKISYASKKYSKINLLVSGETIELDLNFFNLNLNY
ncbi:heparinase II/III family protein [Microbulbifer sp. CnH-101-E]|uniref:heparinase II/III domain-containing protein n=1 Tax=unclassified Microbulbifer TaxID=2619833 RepID=UPI0040397D3A